MSSNFNDAEFSLLDLPQGNDVVAANHDRYRRGSQGHEEWAKMARVCVDFLEGKQYTQAEIAVMESEGRPFIIKNKIAPLFRLLQGFAEQNRYELKFMPGNDGTSTQAISEALSATNKQIDEQNDSDWNDAEVFQDGIACGRGFWDERISFASNRFGDIKETVLDPFEVIIDGEAESYDPNEENRGWNFWTYNRWMSISDIYTMYGPLAFNQLGPLQGSIPLLDGDYYGTSRIYDKPDTSFNQSKDVRHDYEWGNLYQGKYPDHFIANRRLIRVLDCQHKVLKRVNYFMDMETGEEKIIPDQWPRERIQKVMQWAMEHQLPLNIATGVKKVIRWTVTAGDRTLWDDWSPYDRYTIVPYFPYFRRGATRGMINDLIDPQRELNKRSSALLHIIMSTSNSGWMYEADALEEDMKRALEDEGGRPGIHIEYKTGKKAPERIQPAAIPSNVKLLEDQATQDLKEISGINDSALGQIDRVQSGRAILARQKQSVVGADSWFKNFSRGRQLKGKQRLALIQGFYTEPRLIISRSGSGGDKQIWINARDAAGEIVNNVSFGRYNIAVEEAPLSASFMQGQFEEALELVKAGIPIPPDILVGLSSMPNKEEIKQALKEQRLMQEDSARLQEYGMKSSMGIPPQMPAPQVVVDGQPPVVVAQPPPQGMMPPPGQPGMPPQQLPAPQPGASPVPQVGPQPPQALPAPQPQAGPTRPGQRVLIRR